MECPDLKNLEQYVLDELFLKPVNKHITAHLQECPFCRSRYEATKEFYTLFHHEVTHAMPQFPSSIRTDTVPGYDLTHHIPSTVSNYAILSADNKSRKSKSDLEIVAVFTSEEENLMIRLAKHRQSQEYTMYIIANDPVLYEYVLVSVDTIGKTYLTDNQGQIELGPVQIEYPQDLVIQVHVPDIIYTLDAEKVRTALQTVPRGKDLLLKEGIDNRLDIKVQEIAGQYELDFLCRETYSVRHDLIIGFEEDTMYHPIKQTKHFFGFTNIPLKKNFILRLYLGE
ncbi:hypothetical protein [Fidelibacter multiformis]|uniref:hypothetical protein n=1 Tax=Fidelibacter multiformis TaxID=3377529 RepID=UPI0037DD3265